MSDNLNYGPDEAGSSAGANSSQELITFIDQMAFLRQVPLFADMSVAEMGIVSKIALEEEYGDEMVLMEEGKINDSLFIIVEGFVEISSHLNSDQVGSMALLKSKDCFGEEGIFTGIVSNVTAQVIMGDARVIRIDGEKLKKMIRLYPEIGLGLLRSTTLRLHKLQQLAKSMG